MAKMRKTLRGLSARAREGDLEAAEALLSHSVSYGHGRLALRRYLVLRALGGCPSPEAEAFCTENAKRIDMGLLRRMCQDAAHLARKARLMSS